MLPADFAMSLSFWLMTTFGLGPGLSAAMLSRSSRLSVSLRLPWRSRDFPTLVARDAEAGVSSELLSAERMPIWVEMSLPPSSDFRWPTTSLSSLMSSLRLASSSSSILSDGCAPRANLISMVNSGCDARCTHLIEHSVVPPILISSYEVFLLAPMVDVSMRSKLVRPSCQYALTILARSHE